MNFPVKQVDYQDPKDSADLRGLLREYAIFERCDRPELSQAPEKLAGFPTSFSVLAYSDRSQVEAVITEDITTKAQLRYFLRVLIRYRNGVLHATTTGDQGSGILRSMVQANGLMIVPEGKDVVKAGEKVNVQILDRSFELDNQSGIAS